MYQQILDFWFEEIDPAFWWKKDDSFDALLIERFAQSHASACRCEFLNQPGLSF